MEQKLIEHICLRGSLLRRHKNDLFLQRNITAVEIWIGYKNRDREKYSGKLNEMSFIVLYVTLPSYMVFLYSA